MECCKARYNDLPWNTPATQLYACKCTWPVSGNIWLQRFEYQGCRPVKRGSVSSNKGCLCPCYKKGIFGWFMRFSCLNFETVVLMQAEKMGTRLSSKLALGWALTLVWKRSVLYTSSSFSVTVHSVYWSMPVIILNILSLFRILEQGSLPCRVAAVDTSTM